jgi:hypothetical protein
MRQFSARAERSIAINIGTAVMKIIRDIAGRAGIRGYSLQRARAVARVAALTFIACALAGCRVQAGRNHA